MFGRVFLSLCCNSMFPVFLSRFQITSLRIQVPVIIREFLLRKFKMHTKSPADKRYHKNKLPILFTLNLRDATNSGV